MCTVNVSMCPWAAAAARRSGQLAVRAVNGPVLSSPRRPSQPSEPQQQRLRRAISHERPHVTTTTTTRPPVLHGGSPDTCNTYPNTTIKFSARPVIKLDHVIHGIMYRASQKKIDSNKYLSIFGRTCDIFGILHVGSRHHDTHENHDSDHLGCLA